MPTSPYCFFPPTIGTPFPSGCCLSSPTASPTLSLLCLLREFFHPFSRRIPAFACPWMCFQCLTSFDESASFQPSLKLKILGTVKLFFPPPPFNGVRLPRCFRTTPPFPPHHLSFSSQRPPQWHADFLDQLVPVLFSPPFLPPLPYFPLSPECLSPTGGFLRVWQIQRSF